MDDHELRELLAAQTAQIQALTSALNGRAQGPTVGFRALWLDYWQTIKHLSWAPSVRGLMVAVLAHFGDRDVMSLRRPDWTHYRDQVRKTQITRLGTTPTVGTLNLELARVKAMLTWAVAEERIPHSPLASVRREARRQPRETIISDDGMDRLLEVTDAELWAFVVVGVDSGMREEEVRRLRREDIRPGGRVTVSWTAAKTKRTRSVRLSQRALDAIAQLPVGLGGYVFENPATREPYSRTYFWERWRAAVDAAVLEAAPGDTRVHYHDARHTFVTRTIQNGTPLAVAMRASGHISLASVNRYFHVEQEALDEMKARNDLAIAKRRGPRAARPLAEAEPRKLFN